MNSIDFQASMHNLSQMDRHQQETHRAPVMNQEQNADISRDEAAQRVDMPVQPDQTENKNIDPQARRRREWEERKRRRKEKEKEKKQRRSRDSGRFVDLNI